MRTQALAFPSLIDDDRTQEFETAVPKVRAMLLVTHEIRGWVYQALHIMDCGAPALVEYVAWMENMDGVLDMVELLLERDPFDALYDCSDAPVEDSLEIVPPAPALCTSGRRTRDAAHTHQALQELADFWVNQVLSGLERLKTQSRADGDPQREIKRQQRLRKVL
jgi:hypothetical protein